MYRNQVVQEVLKEITANQRIQIPRSYVERNMVRGEGGIGINIGRMADPLIAQLNFPLLENMQAENRGGTIVALADFVLQQLNPRVENESIFAGGDYDPNLEQIRLMTRDYEIFLPIGHNLSEMCIGGPSNSAEQLRYTLTRSARAVDMFCTYVLEAELKSPKEKRKLKRGLR